MSVAARQHPTDAFTLLRVRLDEWFERANRGIDTVDNGGDVPEHRPIVIRANKISTTPEVEARYGDWIAKAMPRLQEAAALRENWDGHGSPPTDPLVVKAAAEMLTRLGDEDMGPLPAPFVCAVSGGGLQFEWSSCDKHLELELIGPDTVAFLKEEQTPGGERVESGEYGARDLERTRQLLCWFIAA